jgi:hypothetical protein
VPGDVPEVEGRSRGEAEREGLFVRAANDEAME